jgi:thiol-disulfide isomerase/thioredoxin
MGEFAIPMRCSPDNRKVVVDEKRNEGSGMRQAAILGAVFVLMATVVAYGNIARGTWSRAAEHQTTDVRQFLAQIVAETPHPLVGRLSPDFTAETLSGNKVTLSDFRGKSVVVLDFWATWCPPCRASMPILEKMASEYAAKGAGTPVRFLAVNQGESGQSVRRFLERSGLKLNVVLDQDQSIAEEFKVEGIPQTVLIGVDGTVQAVHVGFGQDTESRLRMELDALTQGKNLVTPRA